MNLIKKKIIEEVILYIVIIIWIDYKEIMKPTISDSVLKM
jgi:hypothetical protein